MRKCSKPISLEKNAVLTPDYPHTGDDTLTASLQTLTVQDNHSRRVANRSEIWRDLQSITRKRMFCSTCTECTQCLGSLHLHLKPDYNCVFIFRHKDF